MIGKIVNEAVKPLYGKARSPDGFEAMEERIDQLSEKFRQVPFTYDPNTPNKIPVITDNNFISAFEEMPYYVFKCLGDHVPIPSYLPYVTEEMKARGREIVLYNARDLYKLLGIKSKFPDWIKDRIRHCFLKKNVDYYRSTIIFDKLSFVKLSHSTESWIYKVFNKPRMFEALFCRKVVIEDNSPTGTTMYMSSLGDAETLNKILRSSRSKQILGTDFEEEKQLKQFKLTDFNGLQTPGVASDERHLIMSASTSIETPHVLDNNQYKDTSSCFNTSVVRHLTNAQSELVDFEQDFVDNSPTLDYFLSQSAVMRMLLRATRGTRGEFLQQFLITSPLNEHLKDTVKREEWRKQNASLEQARQVVSKQKQDMDKLLQARDQAILNWQNMNKQYADAWQALKEEHEALKKEHAETTNQLARYKFKYDNTDPDPANSLSSPEISQQVTALQQQITVSKEQITALQEQSTTLHQQLENLEHTRQQWQDYADQWQNYANYLKQVLAQNGLEVQQ